MEKMEKTEQEEVKTLLKDVSPQMMISSLRAMLDSNNFTELEIKITARKKIAPIPSPPRGQRC
ncbi:MAG: hypothetical protein PHE17_18240 [Thiothrix sp.]|uniref:hypothetical protein n=1 Tax=Thiothrix sp. TaxID=1032 RepID=UPI00261420E9|nr:hypothetical protein [Thiothrix sp.]MDD5394962.1 hypothetical protein [Thiothrix sp.]